MTARCAVSFFDGSNEQIGPTVISHSYTIFSEDRPIVEQMELRFTSSVDLGELVTAVRSAQYGMTVRINQMGDQWHPILTILRRAYVVSYHFGIGDVMDSSITLLYRGRYVNFLNDNEDDAVRILPDNHDNNCFPKKEGRPKRTALWYRDGF